MSLKETLKIFIHFEPLRQQLYRVIFGINTRAGRIFDIALLCAILTSVLLIMLESVAEIYAHFGFELRVAEWILTVLFTIEYLARIISSKKPFKYIFSFMGIVDLLSLFPTYIGLFFDGTHSLAIIRSIRLIRVFRVLKLTHFMGGANQLGTALYQSRHKIIVFLGTILCTVCILGTLMYLIEGNENGFTSIPRSIYWSIVTITTVGYGDIAPQTWLGQLVASMLMIIGYAIIAVPTGIVTSEMVKANNNVSNEKIVCHECQIDDLQPTDNYCHNCGVEL